MPGDKLIRMNRRRIIVIVSAVLLLGGLAVYHWPTREPVHDGKTLTEWLEIYMTGTNNPACEFAIRTIGTNGIPTLLKLSSARDLPGVESYYAFIQKRGKWAHVQRPSERKHQLALCGFNVLGSTATPASPALMRLVTAGNTENMKLVALMSLLAIKPDKATIIPFLTRCVGDTDRTFARTAASQFRHWYPAEAEKAGVYKMFPDLRPRTVSSNEPVIP
jgi:hypothetical protein